MTEFRLVKDKDINEGDTILVIKTDGMKEIFEVVVGKLTKKWEKDEFPDCKIDNKQVDLVSEGHTSIILKKYS